jgi:hypothetical protein
MADLMSETKPALTEAQALECAFAQWGVAARQAVQLSSERDQAFMLISGDGLPTALLTVSNLRESALMLDCEAAAVAHAHSVDPSLPLVPPRLPERAKLLGSARRLRKLHGGAELKARAQWPGAAGAVHWVRLYDVLPGETRDAEEGPLPDALLVSWGELQGRLSRALRSFCHPGASRTKGFPYDVRSAPSLHPLLVHCGAADLALCASALALYDLRTCGTPRAGLARARRALTRAFPCFRFRTPQAYGGCCRRCATSSSTETFTRATCCAAQRSRKMAL